MLLAINYKSKKLFQQSVLCFTIRLGEKSYKRLKPNMNEMVEKEQVQGLQYEVLNSASDTAWQGHLGTTG